MRVSIGVCDWTNEEAEDIVKKADECQADYIGCNVRIHIEVKNIYSLYNKIMGFPVEHYMLDSKFAPTCCLVVHKKVIKKIGSFDPKLISSGDYEFGNRVYEA